MTAYGKARWRLARKIIVWSDYLAAWIVRVSDRLANFVRGHK